MKVLYLECKMGIAGDMLASSLLGLFEDKEKVVEALNAINVPKVQFGLEEMKKCGIKGDHLTVMVNGEEETSQDVSGSDDHQGDHHHHGGHGTTPAQIEEIIEGLNISKEIRSDIREVYEILAEAESEVHGTTVSEIHFHEVGNLDAIAEIKAVCYLMHELDPDKVIVSPTFERFNLPHSWSLKLVLIIFFYFLIFIFIALIFYQKHKNISNFIELY